MKPKTAFFASVFLLVMPGFTFAQNQKYLEQETEFYARCIAQAAEDPDASLDMALTWRDTGGGLPARHCVAVSFTGLGKYQAAAIEFETLADEMRRGLGWSFNGVEHPNNRGLLSEVYGQGGNAWLLAGDPVKAFDLFTLGLSVAEEGSIATANLLIDRALANGEMGDYESALEDLAKVQTLVQANADLYVLKASAYRALEKYPEAMVELERASRIDPENREAFLERGNLLREMGDKNGARENWIAYLRLYPDGPAANIIRRNLETMDVRIEEFK